ncbi:MAG: tetratricopeptide repeat protein [Thermodesulfobacteriota bacterium]
MTEPPPPTSPRPRAVLAAMALLVAITAGVYANSFHGPFTFDDADNIVENRALRIDSLSWTALARAASSGPSSHRWLPNLTFALNYALGGDEVWGFHLGNLLVHLGAALLVFTLAWQILARAQGSRSYPRPLAVALVAALLWSCHPLGTNAVTYIVQRMTSMATLFSLASLALWIQGRDRGRAGWPWLTAAGLAWIAALASKENAAMLPVMIWGFELALPRTGYRPLDWRFFLALPLGLALLAGLGLLYTGGDPVSGILAGYELRSFTLVERLLTEARVVWHYLGLLVLPLPSRLTLAYDFPVSHDLLDPPSTLAALLGLLVLVAAMVASWRRWPLVAFALFWLLGNLVIESTVLPLELVFEHRLYLPMVLVAIAASAEASRLLHHRPRLLAGLAILVVVSLGMGTWQRNRVWASEETLWQDVVAKAPRLSRGYINLAKARSQAGQDAEAEALLRKALAQSPDDGNVALNLGIACERQARLEEALAMLQRAGRAKMVDRPQLHSATAIVLRKLGRFAEAQAQARLALSLQPDLLEARLTLAVAAAQLGDHPRAVQLFREAAAQGLDSVDLYNNWAVSLFTLGQVEPSVALLRRAVQLDPRHPESHYNLGIAYSAQGLLAEARQEMTLAMALEAELAQEKGR